MNVIVDFKDVENNFKDHLEVLNFFAIQRKKYISEKIEINTFVAIVLSDVSICGEDLTNYRDIVPHVLKNIVSIENIGVVATLKKLANDNRFTPTLLAIRVH